MPTIRDLVDRYGQPPREIALDWAWQVRQRLVGNDGGTQSQPRPDECLLAHRAWTEIEVSLDGQLVCDNLDRATAHQALEDLSSWAQYELPYSTLPLDSPDNLPQPALSASVDETDSLEELGEAPHSHNVSPKIRPVNASRNKRTTHWLPTRGRWSLAIVAGLLLCLSVLFFWPGKKNAPALAASALSPASEPNASSAEETRSSEETGPEVPSFESLALYDPAEVPFNDPAAQPTPTMSQLQVDASLSLDTNSESPAPRAENDRNSNGNEMFDARISMPAAQSNVDRPAIEATNDSLIEVAQTLKQAEKNEQIAVANKNHVVMPGAHGDPWTLSRDTMRYRVDVPPQLNISSRESQWTLALEPVAGLAIEPQRPVTIGARGLAVWRIYDAEAKPPRACLFVRAFHRGKDGQLELVFCGGAEDMPGMSVPLGARWLEPLIVRVQSQAIELRGGLAQISTSVITRDQVPAVAQRKQAMLAQMFTATRLGVIMPEINRLAQLVDGQVTMHAALKSKADEPPIASWGRLP